MSFEGIKPPSQELSPRAISDQLIEKLGTADIPFIFRTANNSVYVSDRKLQTLRFRAANNSFQPSSGITVYLDHKYLDYTAKDVGRSEYLANTKLHKEGILLLNDAGLIKEKRALIRSFADIPKSMEVEDVNKALSIVVFDSVAKKVVRKTPVSLMPKLGFHPIEFFSQRSASGDNSHVGNQIENLVVTNRMNEENTREAIESLTAVSLENKKNQPPPLSLDDLNIYLG